MLTDRELQTMRNLGGFSEDAAAEIERLRAEVAGLRELLEVAQQGLLWYQDTYPDAVNECDYEVMAQIDAALAVRKGTTPGSL